MSRYKVICVIHYDIGNRCTKVVTILILCLGELFMISVFKDE